LIAENTLEVSLKSNGKNPFTTFLQLEFQPPFIFEINSRNPRKLFKNGIFFSRRNNFGYFWRKKIWISNVGAIFCQIAFD